MASRSVIDHGNNINNFSGGIEKHYSVCRNKVTSARVFRFVFSRKSKKAACHHIMETNFNYIFVEAIYNHET